MRERDSSVILIFISVDDARKIKVFIEVVSRVYLSQIKLTNHLIVKISDKYLLILWKNYKNFLLHLQEEKRKW